MRYQKLLKLLAGLAGVMLAATGALPVALVAAGQVREGQSGALISGIGFLVMAAPALATPFFFTRCQAIADADTVLPCGIRDLAFVLAERRCDTDAALASRGPCISGTPDTPHAAGSPSQYDEA